MGQISAGKFTERPPLSENINSTLLYQKIALKATYTTKNRISFFKDFSTGPGSALLPRYLLGTGGCGPGTPWSRAAVRCTMAARLEGGCGPYRPARVDALPDGPGGLPTQFGGMCAVLAWATPPRTAVRRTCRGPCSPLCRKCRRAPPGLFFTSMVPYAPTLRASLSRCGGCATPHCLPLREKHLAPAAQLLFRLRGALCGCDPRLRASCHAAGWAHGRVAKRPFREKCRWASPSLFFRLHVLLAPLCAYPPRF